MGTGEQTPSSSSIKALRSHFCTSRSECLILCAMQGNPPKATQPLVAPHEETNGEGSARPCKPVSLAPSCYKADYQFAPFYPMKAASRRESARATASKPGQE